MCTVTYLPKAKGQYILTSSRDEKTVRPAAALPKEYLLNGKSILFPKDPLAGGSWIAYTENKTACLLNGGFKKHIFNPPYKKSRGLVLLDYFSFQNAIEFSKNYDFYTIEPFTLVLVEPNDLYELRWDGQQITLTNLDRTLPYIWSSVTLYSDEIISKRKNWFLSWLESNPNFTVEAIRFFHRNGGEGDKENDFLMNRNDLLMTISITSIEKKDTGIELIYEDLINNSSSQTSLAAI